MNIFQSAVNKLTLWYVGTLFLVCLVFSVPTYFIASNSLAHGALRQAKIIEEVGPFGERLPARVSVLRDQQLDRDRQQLLRTIVIVNIAILSLGAYCSYQLAKHSLKPIEEAHEAQTRFTTDASHELRTPLATMQAEIEVALRDKHFTAAGAKQVLQSNLEEIARLRGLSEQLLNLTRLDNGTLQKTELNLSQLVQATIKDVEKHHPGIIESNVAKDVKLPGDESLLRELLTILTDNAVKYTGAAPAKVMIGLEQAEDSVVLTVTDRGIGIKASELPHVFDRFYRGADATKHNSNGHGLGLSLAKQIVKAHGGTITATSQPGKQTTFQITLPA